MLLELARRPVLFLSFVQAVIGPAPVAAKRNIHDALQRLAAAEDEFLRGEFLAPVLRGQGVQVRIAGVRCQLSVEPADFQGWGVYRPLSHTQARLVRPAGMGERRKYLDLFPALSV